MFIASGGYFATRFASSDFISSHYQAAILTVSTIVNLATVTILQNIQLKASYPFRINLALIIDIVIFSLLAGSTIAFTDVSPATYFAFTLLMVGLTAYATGLIQNGALAFAASFKRPEYMHAVIMGQAVAGFLPPLALLVTILSVGDNESGNDGTGEDGDSSGGQASSSGFIYFLTAVCVAGAVLLGFMPLVKRHNRIIEARMVERLSESVASIEEVERASRKVVGMKQLFSELKFLCLALVFCFAITMFYPVFAQKIVSVRDPENAPGIFQTATFIPLAILLWNLGDFSGRFLTGFKPLQVHSPWVLFFISIARVGFVPLFLLCNIGGRGAVISSDYFYLIVVQFLFGVTNGWLGSNCFIGAGEWVEEGEREAAGAFMGLCLMVGLTVGSLLSFSVGSF